MIATLNKISNDNSSKCVLTCFAKKRNYKRLLVLNYNLYSCYSLYYVALKICHALRDYLEKYCIEHKKQKAGINLHSSKRNTIMRKTENIIAQ